ncbi:MAG: ferritin family protein, partial [bacterium]|nr:ferritin family protein [bacterium]
MNRKDALLLAIRNEVKAKEAYERIASMVANFVMKDKCLFLAGEEQKHRDKLDGMFTSLYPGEKAGEPPDVEKTRLDIALEGDATVPELLAAAMGAEKASEKFYNELAESSEEDATKEFFKYLASVESSPYYLV